jgi:hypothetical protein
LGDHSIPNLVDERSREQQRGLDELLVSAYIAYTCACAAIKLSVIIVLLRIFRQKIFRWIMYITAAVVSCLFLSSIPLTLFQCTPGPVVTDTDIHMASMQTQCINFVTFLYVSTIIRVSIELVLVLAPLVYLRKLLATRRQKAGLATVFVFGGL